MSNAEYVQLVDFLGEKFAAIDQRFEQIDQRFEQVDQRFDQIDQRLDSIESRLTRVEVYGEETRRLVQITAEGIATCNRRAEDLKVEMDARLTEQRELFVAAHRDVATIADLERRVRILEERA